MSTPPDTPQASAAPTILLTNPILAGLERPLSAYPRIRLWEQGDPLAFAASAEGAKVRAIVTDGGSPLDRALVAALPNLGLIAAVGSGYDGVDVAHANSCGVRVTHSPQVNHEDVADLTLGLVLATVRGIVFGDALVRSGGWTETSRGPTRKSMRGLKVGIVGLGAIGEALGRRLDACLCEVRWWGPTPKPGAPWPYVDSLLQLARDSDVLAVAARSDHTNEGLISAEVLEALGPEGVLVNVSRGPIVDEDALIAALRAGRLGGAGLDVFRQEPTPPERWADVPNVVLTPHIGGSTPFALRGMLELVLENLRRFAAGEPLATEAKAR